MSRRTSQSGYGLLVLAFVAAGAISAGILARNVSTDSKVDSSKCGVTKACVTVEPPTPDEQREETMRERVTQLMVERGGARQLQKEGTTFNLKPEWVPDSLKRAIVPRKGDSGERVRL